MLGSDLADADPRPARSVGGSLPRLSRGLEVEDLFPNGRRWTPLLALVSFKIQKTNPIANGIRGIDLISL